MSEVPSDQTELISNIPQRITEFLEYGRNNGGWNNLLNIGILENDIFILSSSWEEIKVMIRSYNNERSNFLEQEMENINNRLDKLEKLSEEIVETLREKIVKWPEFEIIRSKRDPGVILKALEKVDSSRLTQDKKRMLDSLIRLLDEFILEYEEWKIFRENNLNKLVDILDNIRKEGVNLHDKGGLKSNTPTDPAKINRRVRQDSGWDWNRNRKGTY